MIALRIAGWANIIIGLLHIATLPWLRRLSYWFGIGAEMDRLAAIHWLLPYALTVATAAAFGGVGIYALSAAGDFRPLPMAKLAVAATAWLYLLRAAGGTGMGGYIEDRGFKEITLSTMALAIGILYVIGARALQRAG